MTPITCVGNYYTVTTATATTATTTTFAVSGDVDKLLHFLSRLVRSMVQF